MIVYLIARTAWNLAALRLTIVSDLY
ncbi:uncharacterized protein METZ01_LOCUS210499 [marine metagenome]|uniref:Uncharacterized protein n=1 Tax=marine metagenome TaxID=408172 RepID=A0A382F4N2_9ZZZZ